MSKPATFTVEPSGNVVRLKPGASCVERLVIFRAATKAKGQAFLAAYKALPLELRRKLRMAVS